VGGRSVAVGEQSGRLPVPPRAPHQNRAVVVAIGPHAVLALVPRLALAAVAVRVELVVVVGRHDLPACAADRPEGSPRARPPTQS